MRDCCFFVVVCFDYLFGKLREDECSKMLQYCLPQSGIDALFLHLPAISKLVAVDLNTK